MNELSVRVKKNILLFPKNYTKSLRGHDITLVFLCICDGKPKKGRFFADMPKDMVVGHKKLWKELKKDKIISQLYGK